MERHYYARVSKNAERMKFLPTEHLGMWIQMEEHRPFGERVLVLHPEALLDPRICLANDRLDFAVGSLRGLNNIKLKWKNKRRRQLLTDNSFSELRPRRKYRKPRRSQRMLPQSR
jgi:hypothetical protein